MVAYMLAKHSGAFTEQSIAMARDFCERCWDRSNRASAFTRSDSEMDQVFMVVEQKQYRDLLQCVASLNTQSLRAKHNRFKPAEGVEESPRKGWQFAVKSVCWENARQRQNQGWKAFVEFKALRMESIELYKRKSATGLTDAGVAARPAALEEKLSLENIVLFRKIAKEEMKVEGVKKGVWSRFFKKGNEEEEPVWTEKTREELFSEFDIDESDVSPWEGGRPDDVQVTAQFKLNKLGVSLRTNGRAVLEMRFVQLATNVVKKKAFLQVFAALNDLSMEDESAEAGALRQVVYPEKNAVFDAAKLSVFVPSALVREGETPFFQAALEIPSLDKSADRVVRDGRAGLRGPRAVATGPERAHRLRLRALQRYTQRSLQRLVGAEASEAARGEGGTQPQVRAVRHLAGRGARGAAREQQRECGRDAQHRGASG